MRDLHATGRSRSARVFLAVATALGVVALVAELIGLVTGSTVALAVLVAGMIALWLIADGTARIHLPYRAEERT